MKWKSLVTVVLFNWALLLVSVSTVAANPPDAPQNAVVLVMDASGSMVQNDPNRVRVTAAQRTLDFLHDMDRLALIEFASAPRVIVPLRPIGSAGKREEMHTLIEQVGQQGATDILGGLRSAHHQLTGAPADACKYVILFSDGESDVPGITDTSAGRQRYLTETEDLLARYQDQGWAVHCIAFHETNAGRELENIAAKTGGEYQFISGPDELKNIFANILVAAKHLPDVKPSFHVSLPQHGGYQVGEELVAQAFITIGQDRVLPGPFLEVFSMNLVISEAGREPLVVPFAADTDNGIYRAAVRTELPGEYDVQAELNARYRDHEFGELVSFGSVRVGEEVQSSLLPFTVDQMAFVRKNLTYVGSAVLYVLVAVFTVLLWRMRRREKVSGDLRVWMQTNNQCRYAKYCFRLHKAGKRDVKIASTQDRDTDFRLEASGGRDFAFLIRSMRDPVKDPRLSPWQRLFKGPRMLYEVVCLPGTAMQIDDRLRTRSVLYNGDSFEIDSYIFGFECAFIGNRPDGEDVLNSYSLLMEGSKGKSKDKGKVKKVLTLRRKPT
ncbi:MAG: VWA domain-containing protein [Clostridia bacterium]|nr:VWA domain-containing protein [Clostridia bacterium]